MSTEDQRSWKLALLRTQSCPYSDGPMASWTKDSFPLLKFSQLVERVVLEVDRNPGSHPDGNVAEVHLWRRGSEEADSLTSVPVARRANTNATYIRTSLYGTRATHLPGSEPSRRQLHPDLGESHS